jgi:hypothetical protein
MRRLRQRTIEPVFGNLLQHYCLRRVNTRGRSNAHKTMLLTAIAFNLKKLLKHQPTKTLRLVIALPISPLGGSFYAAGAGATAITIGLATGSKDRAGVLQQPLHLLEPTCSSQAEARETILPKYLSVASLIFGESTFT